MWESELSCEPRARGLGSANAVADWVTSWSWRLGRRRCSVERRQICELGRPRSCQGQNRVPFCLAKQMARLSQIATASSLDSLGRICEGASTRLSHGGEQRLLTGAWDLALEAGGVGPRALRRGLSADRQRFWSKQHIRVLLGTSIARLRH